MSQGGGLSCFKLSTRKKTIARQSCYHPRASLSKFSCLARLAIPLPECKLRAINKSYEDACHDRGSTFRLKSFLNDEDPSLENCRKLVILLHDSCRVPRTLLGFSFGSSFVFLYTNQILVEVFLSAQIEEPQKNTWCTPTVACV